MRGRSRTATDCNYHQWYAQCGTGMLAAWCSALQRSWVGASPVLARVGEHYEPVVPLHWRHGISSASAAQAQCRSPRAAAKGNPVHCVPGEPHNKAQKQITAVGTTTDPRHSHTSHTWLVTPTRPDIVTPTSTTRLEARPCDSVCCRALPRNSSPPGSCLRPTCASGHRCVSVYRPPAIAVSPFVDPRLLPTVGLRTGQTGSWLPQGASAPGGNSPDTPCSCSLCSTALLIAARRCDNDVQWSLHSHSCTVPERPYRRTVASDSVLATAGCRAGSHKASHQGN